MIAVWTKADPPKPPTQKQMALLILATRRKMDTLLQRFLSGSLSAQEFGVRMAVLLEDRHTRAATMGRNKAGDIAPFEESDRAFAQQVMDGESVYLKNFVSDLEDGRYLDADGVLKLRVVTNRAHAYTGRVVGTANEMFGAASVLHRVYWRLGGTEHHCTVCPARASGGPYRWDEMPGWPGDNSTPCLANCKCFVEREDGITGFMLVE